MLTLVGGRARPAIRPLSLSKSVALRHAVLRLSRPGNQTRAVLLAVGLGAFFIVGRAVAPGDAARQFSVAVDSERADMFLIDVQPGQAAGVAAFLLTERAGRRPPPSSRCCGRGWSG